MNKKDILIVAIVAVVASLAVSAFAPQVGLAPGISNVADACNGDKVCEMNNALITGSLEVYEANIEEQLNADIIKTTDLMVDDGLLQAENAMVGSLEVIGTSTFRSTLGDSIFVAIQPTLANPIWATAYAGNGTAYACISAHGNIFRSEGPCI